MLTGSGLHRRYVNTIFYSLQPHGKYDPFVTGAIISNNITNAKICDWFRFQSVSKLIVYIQCGIAHCTRQLILGLFIPGLLAAGRLAIILAISNDEWLNLLWNCPYMNETGLHWWISVLNIRPANGFVLSDKKPLFEPILTQIYVDIRRNWVTVGQSLL